MTITIEVPDDVIVPEGLEAEAETIARQSASHALRRRFMPPADNRTQQERLASLLSVVGTFKSKPRADGRAWSEIEGFPDDEPAST